MPRKHRPLAPDVVYHVGSRRVDKRPCFDVAPRDRVVFLGLLDHVVHRYRWRCHSYCLMGNHFHLVVDTPEANLSEGMRYLKGEYAQWFNAVSGREGALFERRFWSGTADTDDYLYEICRYVALNPVRAGLCRTPEQWPWSSYAATLGLIPAPSFLTVGDVLAWFGGGERGAVRYAQFVGEGMGLTRRAA
jgi:REP element-mobilizing transposase RayT